MAIDFILFKLQAQNVHNFLKKISIYLLIEEKATEASQINSDMIGIQTVVCTTKVVAWISNLMKNAIS